MLPISLCEHYAKLAQILADILDNPNTPERVRNAISAFDCDLYAVVPSVFVPKVLAAEMRGGLVAKLTAISDPVEDERIFPQMEN